MNDRSDQRQATRRSDQEMSLTEQQVKALSFQARLQLTAEEIVSFTSQLNKILQYVAIIQEVSVDDLEPTIYGVSLTNIWREDRVRLSLEREAVLANAPEQENFCFKVPKILEED